MVTESRIPPAPDLGAEFRAKGNKDHAIGKARCDLNVLIGELDMAATDMIWGDTPKRPIADIKADCDRAYAAFMETVTRA